MNDQPVLQIIIPVHNAATFIRRTIISIVTSNVGHPYGLLFVLDNCSDASSTVITALMTSYGDVPYTIIETHHGSPALARNAGLQAATATFVAFVDHDDAVDPDMYRKLLAEAAAIEADVVRCGLTRQSEDFWTPELPATGRAVYPFFGIFVWNGIFRRSLLEEHKINFAAGYGEDYEFNFDVNRYASRIS
jgi:glycosyltransferase involved in cell wall biosynthesis